MTIREGPFFLILYTAIKNEVSNILFVTLFFDCEEIRGLQDDTILRKKLTRDCYQLFIIYKQYGQLGKPGHCSTLSRCWI